MADDLSKPPNNAVLLQQIVQDALAQFPARSLVSMTQVAGTISVQCPAGISDEDIVREIVLQIGIRGLAIQFDKPS